MPFFNSKARSVAALWKLHEEAEVFLQSAGMTIPPPMLCNLGLTNKCNLRCEICGSQKFLDQTGTPRRHMELSTFEAVAKTLFPFLVQVELNSQGDPLLYPEIEKVLETIAAHECQIKVQTNGTLFTDRIIELLVKQHGTVMLSLDAVGPRFDEVRRGGNWSKAEPQMKKFLRARNPRRLRVGLYPTVTRRTLSEVLNILDWCQKMKIDEVSYHRYSPILDSFEEEPSHEEMKAARERIEKWIDMKRPSMKIVFDGEFLHGNSIVRKRFLVAGPRKLMRWGRYHLFHTPWTGLNRKFPPMFPVDAEHQGAHPEMVCAVPNYYLEIGLEGQVHTCCRAQDVTLGYATSPAEFAAVWLGENYAKIRRSLRRDATGPYPLPNCESCVKFHTRKYNPTRKALKYDGTDNQSQSALQFADDNLIRIDLCGKEVGFCHIARLPLSVDPSAFELWEGETRLGPGFSQHDDIRFIGRGRYSIWGGALYFSASDNSDARANGRQYQLRKINKELLIVPSEYNRVTTE